jgi:protein SCO1
MNRPTVRLCWAVLVAVTVMLVVSSRGAQPDSYKYFAYKIPNPSEVSQFTLMGPDGKPYALSSLRGKLVLLVFGFTNCPNTCPTTLANLAATYERLSPPDQLRVQVLFITIDPQRDTAPVLKDFVTSFDHQFIGLTGTPDEIAAVAKGFKVELEETHDWGGDAANYTLSHSAGALLLAPSGQLIAFYGTRQLRQIERVAGDLRHFLLQSDLSADHWRSLEGGLVKTPRLSGRELYLEQCSSCHGEEGGGILHKYPALAGSNWVKGAPNRLTALVLGGVRDKTAGASVNHGVMPAWWNVIPPSDVSAILTYIRQAWNNKASAISAAYTRKLGYEFGTRSNFWTWKQLEALPPDKASDASTL